MIRYYQRPPLCAGLAIEFKRHTYGASGFDLHADIAAPLWLPSHGRVVIEAGIHLEMPLGIGATTRPRSGLFRDHGVMSVQGSIDSDYRGIVGVQLVNFGDRPYQISPGDRVAQLVFEHVVIPGVSVPEAEDVVGAGHFLVRVNSLDQLAATARGAGGFGSTGV